MLTSAKLRGTKEIFIMASLALATKEDLNGLKDLEMKLDTRSEKLMGEMVLFKWMLRILIAGVISLVLKAFF